MGADSSAKLALVVAPFADESAPTGEVNLTIQPAFVTTPDDPPHSFAHQQRDFVDWHRHRPYYLLWALELDQPAVAARFSLGQAHLVEELLPDYRRQPHVTVSLCGFPQRSPQAPDEFGPATLAAQLHALQALALAPFSIEIGAMDSFLAAPYLQVSDHGQLQQLHRALAIAPPPGADIAYQPHLTLGLYRHRKPMSLLAALIDRFAPLPALTQPIAQLSLLAYASKDIAGPLTTVARYSFVDQRLRPAAMQLLPFVVNTD